MPINTFQDRADDYSDRYKAYRQKVEERDVDDEMEAILGRRRQFQKRPESMSSAQRVYNPTKETPVEEGIFARFVDDVSTGLGNSPAQALGGVVDALNETANFGEDVASLFGAQFDIPEIPTTDDPESITGSLIRSTTQFLTGFIGAQRPARLIKSILPGTERAKILKEAALKDRSEFSRKFVNFMGEVIEAELVGAGATFIVFDPHEDRLSTYLNTIPGLSEIVPDYLADNNPDNETVWEGRMKNAVEGAGLGAFFGGLMSIFRAYKGRRIEPDAPVDETINVDGPPGVEEPRSTADELGVEPAREFSEGDGPIGMDDAPDPDDFLADAEITLTQEAPVVPEERGVVLRDILRRSQEQERIVPDDQVELLSTNRTDKTFLTEGDIPSRARQKLRLDEGFAAADLPEEISEFNDLIVELTGESLLGGVPLGPEGLVLFDELVTKFRRGIEEAEFQFDTPRVREEIDIAAKAVEGVEGEIDFGAQALIAKRAFQDAANGVKAAEERLLAVREAQKAGGTPAQAVGELSAAEEAVKVAKQKQGTLKGALSAPKRAAIKEFDKLAKDVRTLLVDPAKQNRRARGKKIEQFEKNVQFLKASARGVRRPLSNIEILRLKILEAKKLSGRSPDLGNTVKREWINIADLDPENPIADLIERKKAENKPFIDALKGGDKQTIKEWEVGAGERLRNIEDLVRGPVGFSDPEDVLAMGDILGSASQQLTDKMRLALAPDATDADVAALGGMDDFYNQILSHFEAGTSQLGRAFRATREVRAKIKDLQRIRVTDAGRLEDIDAALRRLGGAKAGRERARSYLIASDVPSSMNKMVRDFNKPSKWDALYEVFINGILSGPGTHFRNVVSTQAFSVLSVPESMWNASISKVFFKGELSFEETAARAMGYTRGWRSAYRLTRYGNRAERIGHLSSEFDIQKQIEISHPNAVSAQTFNLNSNSKAGYAVDMLGRFARFPTRALQAEDNWHKMMGYEMELGARAARKARAEGLEGEAFDLQVEKFIDKPPDDLHIEALDAAHYMTFTDKLPAGFQQGVDALRKVPAGRFIVPFIRTPTNILLRTFERTPLPFILQTQGWKDAVARGGADAAEAYGRMTMGSTLMMGFAAMTMEGIITGPGPENKDIRRALMQTGWRPYSVRIGELYIPYDRLDPIGNIIGVGAAVGEVVNNLSDEDADFVVMNAVSAFGQQLASERYLRGLFDTIGALDPSNPVNSPEGWIQRFAPSLLPFSGFLRGIARSIDPNARIRRTAVGDPDLTSLPGIPGEFNVWLDDTLSGFRSTIPGMSSSLPLDRDLEGNEIKNPSQIFTALDFLNPNWATREKKDKASRAIRENKIGISRASRHIKGVRLTAQEYSEYQLIAGEFYSQRIKRLVDSPSFDGMSGGPNGMKAAQVKGLIRKARAFARARMIRNFPAVRGRIREKESIERAQLQADPTLATPGPQAPLFGTNERNISGRQEIISQLGGK